MLSPKLGHGLSGVPVYIVGVTEFLTPTMHAAAFANERNPRPAVHFLRDQTMHYLGPETSYRLGPWPDLASEERRGKGCWRLSTFAGEQILRAFTYSTQPWVPDWRQLRALGNPDRWRDWSCPPYVYWSGEYWAERATGQGILPLGMVPQKDLVRACCYTQSKTFQRSIPPPWRCLVKRYPDKHLALLRLLSVCPESAQLAEAHPAVFYLLACVVEEPSARLIDRRVVQTLLRGPQIEILKRAGLPAQESVRRFLRKVPSSLVCLPSLKLLSRALVAAPFGRALRHVRVVTPKFLSLLEEEEFWPLLAPSFVGEIAKAGFAEDPHSPEREMMLQLRFLTTHWVEKGRPGITLKSRGDVMKLWRSFYREELAWKETPFEKLGFPRPPFAGTADVMPITTAQELIEEGKNQSNCAGQEWQVRGVGDGSKYFYRVTAPDRATVLIEREKPSDSWLITDVRGPGNSIPSMNTVRMIVEALGLPAQPRWYPTMKEAWWIDGPYAFLPSAFRSTFEAARVMKGGRN
jgi:hypothetical protein